MFRQIKNLQLKPASLVPQSGGQSSSTPKHSADMTRSPVAEHGTNGQGSLATQQDHQQAGIDIAINPAHDADSDRAEISRQVTPFFVRGDRGDPNNLSKIDLAKFDEYLTKLIDLSIAAGGEGNKDEVQKKLVDKLEKIQTINAEETNKMVSELVDVREAASGIDNVKAYTNKVTDLLREVQARAEHLALKSIGNAEQKQKFECLAALFIQTKRLVRGVGAEKILVDSAKTLDEKLMTLMGNRPDSSLISTKTIAVTPPHAFSKYTIGGVDSLVVDEQGLLLYFPAKTVSAAGHGTVGLASMTGGLTAVWGKDNFRAASTFSDLLKTTLNEKANSTWIKSNGSTGRKLLATLSAVKRGLGFITGQLHTEGFSSSIYGNDKLGKTRVENVFAINDAIQRSSLNAEWKEEVNSLVNQFFLPVADDIRIRQEENLPPPADPYDVITELIKGSYSDHGVNFSAQIGKHWDAGNISPGLSGTGVLSYDRFHFDMELPSKPSDLLDSTFHQDVRETLKLHDTIIQKLDPASGSREKAAIFHQYDRMNAAFADLHPDPVDLEFTPDQVNYFGEQNAIQSVFHDPILRHAPQTVTAIKNCLDDLTNIHGNVVQAFSNMGSPRGMPKGLKSEIEKDKREKIRLINSLVWGDAYPDGEKGAMKDPEKFKRQTLYNLEIGLGRVGIELAMLNRHHGLGSTSLDDDELNQLNNRYAGMKEALTSRDFMGNPNLDIRLSPLKTKADFNRHQVIASGTLVAGANLSSLIYKGDVAPSNVAGDLYIKLQAQYENAVNQFDPTREGEFLVLSFELSSGVISAFPPAARLQEHVVHAVSKTAMAIIRKGIENEKVNISDESWQDISRNLIGVLGTNVQTGTKTAIKLHRSYDNVEWRLQKVTESETRQGGIDGSVPFVEIVAKDSSAKQAQQIVGPDWSINKMTIKYLTAAINDTGSMVLNDELAARYFSVPNTISQIIDDGMRWTDTYLSSERIQPSQIQASSGQSAQSAANQGRNGGSNGQPYPSDIHRFLGDSALIRSAEQAPVVSKNAPGSPSLEVASPLIRMSNLCKQVGTSLDWEATKAEWETTKAKIESLTTITERRNYWETDAGKKLLKTFIDMVGIYAEVTTAVAKHADREHQVTRSGMTNAVELPKQRLTKSLKGRLRLNRKNRNAIAKVDEHEMRDQE